MKRQENKHYLISQKQRLGEFVSQRVGHKFVDVWVDGFEFRSIKEKLVQFIILFLIKRFIYQNNIKIEKETLEKTRKNLKIKKTGTLNSFYVNTKPEKIVNKEKPNMGVSFLNFHADSENPDSNSIGDSHIFDVKNRLNFKGIILQKVILL